MRPGDEKAYLKHSNLLLLKNKITLCLFPTAMHYFTHKKKADFSKKGEKGWETHKLEKKRPQPEKKGKTFFYYTFSISIDPGSNRKKKLCPFLKSFGN